MQKGKGYTLIELLVVIAIIALLLAILMPALGRVKKQSNIVTCQANLKQWAVILTMYTDDYNGHFQKGWTQTVVDVQVASPVRHGRSLDHIWQRSIRRLARMDKKL